MAWSTLSFSPTLIRLGDIGGSPNTQVIDRVFCYNTLTALVSLLLVYLEGMTTDLYPTTASARFRYQQQQQQQQQHLDRDPGLSWGGGGTTSMTGFGPSCT
jgi:hypothetical protein